MPRGRQMVRTLGSWARAVLELARVVFAVHWDESRGVACCLEGRHGRAPASGAECRATRVRCVVASYSLAVRARPTRQREARRGLTSSPWRDSHSSSKATASQRRSASASSCRPIPSLHLPAEGQFNKTTFRRILVPAVAGPAPWKACGRSFSCCAQGSRPSSCLRLPLPLPQSPLPCVINSSLHAERP
jgi:hypothetical protein